MAKEFTEPKEFTDKEINDFRDAFDLFDRDNDGAISYKEFCIIMKAFNQNYEELDYTDMFTEADEADSGVISFDQFIKICEMYYIVDISEEGLFKAFKPFDTEGSGIIQKLDLKEIMMNYGDKMTEDEFNDFMSVADPNRTGSIKCEDVARVISAYLNAE